MSAKGIRRPGIFNLLASQYHADPVVRPSLSHSVLRLMLDRSPLHARAAHPRLNPDFKPNEPTTAMIHGSVLHMLILGKGEVVQIIEADSYRKQDARDERDSCLARGVTPILRDDFSDLKKCADAVLAQLRDDPEATSFFAPGRSEAVAIWRIGPVWCRAMIDRLPDAEGAPLWDVKSTGMSARPADWERALAKRYATQAAFYRLGAAHALKRPVGPMRFVVFERDPPYAISIVECGETLVEAAEVEVQAGLRKWAECMILDRWPGYGQGVHTIEAPMHVLMKAEEAKLQWSNAA